MAQAEAGKGSAPRKSPNTGAYGSGWDRIFGVWNEDKDSTKPTAERVGPANPQKEGGEAQ